MAIYKGYRFAIDFDETFGQGLVLVGEVSPDNEYQSRKTVLRVVRLGKGSTN